MCRDNNTDVSAAMPLPRDNCLKAGTCGRFGDGNWDRTAYLNKNHGGAPPASTGRKHALPDLSRRDREGRDEHPAVPLPGFDETGAPQCYNGGAPSAPDRRVVIAAAVDCTANDIGAGHDIVPLEYVKLFMTEPVQSAARIPTSWSKSSGPPGAPGRAR